jgi:hypothetical protein
MFWILHGALHCHKNDYATAAMAVAVAPSSPLICQCMGGAQLGSDSRTELVEGGNYVIASTAPTATKKARKYGFYKVVH